MKKSLCLCLMVMLALVLVTAACASTKTTVTTGSSVSTTSGPASSVSSGAPKYGGTLRIAFPSPTPIIGWPASMGNSASGSILQVCLETLLRQDSKGNVVPWLAESYSVSDDLKSITFKIRQGVKFHDGSDLNADVVKWNLDQFLAAQSAPPAGAPSGAPPSGAGAPLAGAAGGPSSSAAGAATPAGASPSTTSSGAPPAGATAPAGASGAPPTGGVSSSGGGAPASGVATWSSVEVVDPYTVRVDLKSWSNQTVAGFADAATLVSMVSKAAYDKNGLDWMKANPVGTGPFKFASMSQGANIKFVKNPDYWKKGDAGTKLPYLDEVDFIFADSINQRQSMMLAGDADWAVSIEPGQAAADLKAKGMNLQMQNDTNVLLFPDTTTPGSPWANKEVREAAQYALDTAAITKGLGYGFINAIDQIPPQSTTAYDASAVNPRPYDVAKAKQMLAEAGYPNGFDTTLIMSPMGANTNLAVAVQGYWQAIGIKAALETPDAGKFFSYCNPGKWTANAVMMMGVPAIDPSFVGGLNFMFNLVGLNWGRSTDLQNALIAANTSKDAEVDKVRAVTNLMLTDASPLFCMQSATGCALQAYVMNTGLGTRGGGASFSIEQTWLNK